VSPVRPTPHPTVPHPAAKLMERCSDGVEDQGAEERYESKKRFDVPRVHCTTSQCTKRCLSEGVPSKGPALRRLAPMHVELGELLAVLG
jgi:hypothetical protein